MSIEDWFLTGLVGLSLVLAGIGMVMYYVPRPIYNPPPTAPAQHSQEDRDATTRRLTPPRHPRDLA